MHQSSSFSRVRTILVLVVLVCFSLALSASAQNAQEPESLPRPPASAPTAGESPASVSFGGTWNPRANLEGNGGFSRNSWTGEADLRFPLPVKLNGPMLFGGFGFSYTGTFYNFSGHPDIAGSDRPWNQVNIANVSAGLNCRVDSHWDTYANFSVTSAAQSGADMEQSFTYGGVAGADYKFSDKLSVGLAIVVQSRLEQSVQAVPFPAFSWVLPFDNDRWKIFSGGGLGGGGDDDTQGVALGVAYHPFKPLTLAAGVSSLGLANDFRLNARSVVPNGVVEDHFSQLIVATNYQPDKHLSVSGFVGINLPGKLKVVNSAGNAVYTELYSAVPVVGLGVSWRF